MYSFDAWGVMLFTLRWGVTMGVWTSLPNTHNVKYRTYCKFSILWSIKKVSYTLTLF